jgi:hypothetical protein
LTAAWSYPLRRAWLVAAAALTCLVLYIRDPANGAPFPACPFRAITGLDCPFCGTGRALHALLHARAARAFSFNPLVVVAVPVLAVPWLLGRRPSPRAVWITVGVLVAFAIARNLPFAAVSWMASYR